MIRAIRPLEMEAVGGAWLGPFLGFVGGLIAGHYGEKALDAFDNWVTNIDWEWVAAMQCPDWYYNP